MRTRPRESLQVLRPYVVLATESQIRGNPEQGAIPDAPAQKHQRRLHAGDHQREPAESSHHQARSCGLLGARHARKPCKKVSNHFFSIKTHVLTIVHLIYSNEKDLRMKDNQSGPVDLFYPLSIFVLPKQKLMLYFESEDMRDHCYLKILREQGFGGSPLN